MRDAFSRAIIQFFSDEKTFFLTGDLGFKALEGIRDNFGRRFINCGVSEQNMVGVSAGLAKEGYKVFVYSIAPFCYARSYEQIRNDICFNHLSVLLVGNGGGYAYGHMGPTHHALEDCAAMLALPNMHVYVPAFNDDLIPIINSARQGGPSYLRLGLEAKPESEVSPAYAPWRKLLEGKTGNLIALGPLAGLAWKTLVNIDLSKRPTLWAVTELPLLYLPKELEKSACHGPLAVIEEHVVQGGLGMALAYYLTSRRINPHLFIHKHALGYPSKRYGSQAFHRHECSLDEAGILELVAFLLKEE